MGIQDNKALIHDYFDSFRTGRPPLPELLHEEVSWWVPPASRLGGLYEGKAAVLELMQRGVALYDTGVPMQIDVEQLIAEGDRVSAQVTIEARTAQGEAYCNHYHFAFRIRDGRIGEVREYVDTLYAERKLFSC